MVKRFVQTAVLPLGHGLAGRQTAEPEEGRLARQDQRSDFQRTGPPPLVTDPAATRIALTAISGQYFLFSQRRIPPPPWIPRGPVFMPEAEGRLTLMSFF
jgi:hypothetical protein